MAREAIAVIGGGIVGASLAYHLAERADVTLLERAHPAAGATGASFAWINASFDVQPEEFRLRRESMLGWVELERRIGPELRIQRGGSIVWLSDPESARGIEQAVRRHHAWGYPVRLIDRAELRALEPHVEPEPDAVIVYSEDEASLEPAAATAALLRAAEERGARVLAPAEVTGFELGGSRLLAVETTRGAIRADTAVLAAGIDAPRLAARLGLRIPLVDAPGVLAHTAPLVERVAKRVLLAPEIHLKQQLDGRVVIGEHAGGFHSADASRTHGEQLLAAAAHWLPALAKAELERVTLGRRPMPADGKPIVGFCGDGPRVYLAVMHSGVTLAPVIGRLACREILDGEPAELLAPYRLSRFG